MKTLNFNVDESGKEFFETIYEGLAGTTKMLSFPEKRLLDRIMTKMEDVGFRKDAQSMIYTIEKDAVVVLEDAEVALVEACHEAVPWMNGMAARAAGKALAWLKDA